MEGEVMRRRMKMIAAHFVPSDDLSASHLLPMNCSGSFNSVIRRCDNRMLFARQASASQAFFMRQASAAEQREGCSGSSAGAPRKCPNASQEPLFARPHTNRVQHLSSIEAIRGPANVCKSPAFARPEQQITRSKQFHSRQDVYSSSESDGIEWSPRMDVEESGLNYILTVEAPGVNINDIRVEINDQNLTVMGKKSTKRWRSATVDSISRHHRREILRGPYKIVWPLPSNVNKAGLSAEFLDGTLQIVIPKL